MLAGLGALLLPSPAAAQTPQDRIVGDYGADHHADDVARLSVRAREGGFEGIVRRAGRTAASPGCEYGEDDVGKVVLVVGESERVTPAGAGIYSGLAVVIAYNPNTQTCARSNQSVRLWVSDQAMRVCWTPPENDGPPEIDDAGGATGDCMGFRKDQPKPAGIVLPSRSSKCNKARKVRVSFKRPSGVVLNKARVRVTGRKTISRGSKQLAERTYVEFTFPKIRSVTVRVELYASSGKRTSTRTYRICGVK